MTAVDLLEKARLLTESWSPRVVARLNDVDFRVALLEGDFVWHAHEETDEAFLVLEGELHLELRDRVVELRPGQLFVVPKGVEHRPVAPAPCRVLLVEPADTLNTGTAGGERTAPLDRWI